jgi:hypothetical protein
MQVKNYAFSACLWEMMHNCWRRQNPQHVPFQVALATKHALRGIADNFHAQRTEMKIEDLSEKEQAPNG